MPTKARDIMAVAHAIVERSTDAYSYARYGADEWLKCAVLLLEGDFTPTGTEWFLRSVHMRWAADHYGDSYDGSVEHLRSYLVGEHGDGVRRDIAKAKRMRGGRDRASRP